MRNPNALLKHKALFDQYVTKAPHELSVYHFSSIFLWQDFFEFEFETVGESLCIFAHQPKAAFLYLPPLTSSRHDAAAVNHCFQKMNEVNPRTARIENAEQSIAKNFCHPYGLFIKSEEYVYRKQDLIDLKGHAYKSQRHDIHHFESHYQSLFRPYREEDFSSCMSLYKEWMEARYQKHEDDIYRQMLKENALVHELALDYAAPLGLIGFVVEIDKKIAAYSLGYSLNSSTFCVSLEITHPGCTGLSAFIFNRVCADEAVKEHTLINTMDDFGLPYVAASKQAYHPSQKPVSYTVTLTK